MPRKAEGEVRRPDFISAGELLGAGRFADLSSIAGGAQGPLLSFFLMAFRD